MSMLNIIKEDMMSKSKVLFTSSTSGEKLVEMYKKLNVELKGKVAVKVHSGEPGGNNFIKPHEMKDLVALVNGTIVECNTAYQGNRYHTEDHLKAIEDHGFNDIADVDIMDSEGDDLVLKVSPYNVIEKNYVGSHLTNYDSMLVLSHFKGHAMGGFGGALKNTSIGIASKFGKAYIHGGGEPEHIWDCEQDKFLESMADASKSVVDLFNDQIVFINMMIRMSIDCDCDAHPQDPEMKDIGILASTDPVALDQACLDLVYQSNDPKKKSLIERIEEKHGVHILEAADKIGIGSREYELVNVD